MNLVDSVWAPQHINSFEEFTKIVDEFTTPRSLPKSGVEVNRFIFRGAADSNFSLIPSLARFSLVWRDRYQWLTRDMLYDIEWSSLDTFIHKAKLYVQDAFLPKDPAEIDRGSIEFTKAILHWWQIMQHYHANTRLLDWTTSPFVALYFAVVHCPSNDGAVWMVENGAHSDCMYSRHEFRGAYSLPLMLVYGRRPLPTDKREAEQIIRQIRDHQQSTEEKARNCLSFFRAMSPTNRMCAQQGWFSCAATLETDHQTAIADAFKDDIDRKWAKKIIISSRAKSEILRALWSMNLHGETLFPGLDGLGLSIAQIPDLYKPSDEKAFSLQYGQLAVTKQNC